MDYKAKNTIRHSGQTFSPGDNIKGLAKDELQDLLYLDAIEPIGETTEVESLVNDQNIFEPLQIEEAITKLIEDMLGRELDDLAKEEEIEFPKKASVSDKKEIVLKFYEDNDVDLTIFADDQLSELAKLVGITVEKDVDRDGLLKMLDSLFDEEEGAGDE